MDPVTADKRDRLPKHLLIAFAIALTGYALFFALDQYIRTRKGPWEVSFTTNANGFAEIIINQSSLKLTNVRVVLLEEHPTNGFGTVVFDRPLQSLPFGRTKFEDLTYLPGSVTFELFGHEVELLPRTLYLNKQERGWSQTQYELRPSEKLPASALEDPRKRKRH
jgi:hypothetical protein